MAETKYNSLSKYSKDLTGQRFSRWLVLGAIGKDKGGRILWECLCDCGTIKQVASYTLTKGTSKSCGCLISDTSTTHGMYGTP